jgi:hypothetical protein
VFGPAASGGGGAGAALLVVADAAALVVSFAVVGSDFVSDPQPERPIPVAMAAMATTPARSERVIGSPVDWKSRA